MGSGSSPTVTDPRLAQPSSHCGSGPANTSVFCSFTFFWAQEGDSSNPRGQALLTPCHPERGGVVGEPLGGWGR